MSDHRRGSQNINLGSDSYAARLGLSGVTGEGRALNARLNSAKGGGSYSVPLPS